MSNQPTADLTDFRDALLGGIVRRERQLIEDPPDEPVSWPLVSVDDHLLEPPNTFEGRLEARFRDVGPRIVEDDAGLPYWQVEDRRMPIVGGDGQVGWVPEESTIGQVRFDEFRPAIWNVDERVRDMDRCGIAASLCFPSMIFGFAGRKFAECHDRELALACVRAYNDWLAEDWCGAHPTRFIASQLPQLVDIDAAVAEIYRNAERGFTAVTFSENPEKLGLPSIHTGYWDPFLRACEETETVVNLHVGSSSVTMVPSSDSPIETMVALFQVSSMSAAADWLYSGIPLRFPKIKLVLSEGGIGWVPGFIDRLRYIAPRHRIEGDGRTQNTWRAVDEPVDVFMRNFWFTAIDDPTAFQVVADYDEAWIAHFLTEVDYPHTDTTWPSAQQVLRHQLDNLDPGLAEKFAFRNACDLYRLDASTVSAMFADRLPNAIDV